MDFISNQEPQNREMLAAIGVSSVEDLFETVSAKLRLPRPIHDDGLSEFEGMKLMEGIAAKNTFPQFDNYLGAGAYEHHVPAIVGMICGKSEFLTSYTPYQPEASQGMLQAIFEFQSVLCALTGLDVSNASLYDGASACAEALLMAVRCQKKRNKALIAQSLHPHYRAVAEQYISSHDIQIESIAFQSDGQLDMQALERQLDENTATILVQYPSFLGGIDDLKRVSDYAKSKGALTIICANPLVYGLYASAQELGADIAVGDCQPFGLPLQFGGPYVGYIACRQDLMRQLPGRIVGETVDTQGRRGFTLTLQAREQHIRREKATSNICTNQALAALASLISILWYGKEGVRRLALTNFQRAAYLRDKLKPLTLVTPFSQTPVFNEFIVKFKRPMAETLKHFHRHGIHPGVDLGCFYPQLADHLLVAVTEVKNQSQLDSYCAAAKELI